MTSVVEDETRRAVDGYFDACTNDRADEALGLLATDLRFAGPTASYDSAGAFRPALEAFAAMTRGARVIEFIVDGDQAALL